MTKFTRLYTAAFNLSGIAVSGLMTCLLLGIPNYSFAQDTLKLRKLVAQIENGASSSNIPLLAWNRTFIRTVGADLTPDEAPFLERWLNAIHNLEHKSTDLAFDEIDQNVNLSVRPSIRAKLLLFKADYAYVKLPESEFFTRLKKVYSYCSEHDLLKEGADVRNLEGSYWFGKGDFDKASALFLQNVPIQESIKDSAGLIKSYINIGSCQNSQGYNNMALSFFKIAENLISRYPPAFSWKLLVENNIGAVLMSLEENEAAIIHFENLEKRVEKLEYSGKAEQLLLINLNKAFLLIRLNRIDSLKQAVSKIMSLKPYWTGYQREVIFSLSEAYTLFGDEPSARQWLAKIEELLVNGNELMQADYLRAHFKFRKKFKVWAMSAMFRKAWERQMIKPGNLRYNAMSSEVALLLAKDENRVKDALAWSDSIIAYNSQTANEKLSILNSEYNLQNKERLFLDSLSSLRVHVNEAQAKVNFLNNVVLWIVIASVLILLNLAFLFQLSKRRQRSLALEGQLERQKAENLELKNRFLSDRVAMKQRETGLSENRVEYVLEFKQYIRDCLATLDEVSLMLDDQNGDVKNKIRNKEQQIRNLLVVLNQNESQLKQVEIRNKEGQSWIELLGPVWLEMSETERDITRLVREGFTNKEIADKLEKSQMYIEKLRSRIRKRLNISKEQDLQQYLLTLSAED